MCMDVEKLNITYCCCGGSEIKFPFLGLLSLCILDCRRNGVVLLSIGVVIKYSQAKFCLIENKVLCLL